MTCEDARRSIPLIQYAEISFDEEELVHAHMAECAACRGEFERERSLHDLLDERELDVSPFSLRNSRDQLAEALAAERTHRSHLSWWSGLKSAFQSSSWVPVFVKPAGAVALVALGFFAARLMPPGSAFGVQTAGLVDASNARVRYAEPDQKGDIRLVVDETRQRVITGRLDDSHIRGLLLAAAKDPADPGLRVECVDILKSQSESVDVRNVLLAALENDDNAGVRLKALEGLKRYAAQPDVRQALSQVLLSDQNPGLRTQAIDLLTQNSNEDNIIGVLQESMHREDNGYIRLRCEKALRAMKASVDTY